MVPSGSQHYSFYDLYLPNRCVFGNWKMVLYTRYLLVLNIVTKVKEFWARITLEIEIFKVPRLIYTFVVHFFEPDIFS